MSNEKIKQSVANLENALQRLNEALNDKSGSTVVIDGTIQRFEFALELYWKLFRRLLEAEGIQADTPRTVLKQAYAIHWIDDETLWLNMLKDRNLTSHVYDEEMAKKIYQRIIEYYPVYAKTLTFIKSRFKKYL